MFIGEKGDTGPRGLVLVLKVIEKKKVTSDVKVLKVRLDLLDLQVLKVSLDLEDPKLRKVIQDLKVKRVTLGKEAETLKVVTQR